MKVVISILLSIIVFGASFQNSLYFIDYLVNRDYYEAKCINKQKSELNCKGKCKVKSQSEKENYPVSEIRYAFELNILPTKSVEIEFSKPFEFLKTEKIIYIKHTFTLEGHCYILPDPPQVLGYKQHFIFV